jgi:hypothetical protein
MRPRLDSWDDFGSDYEYAHAPALEFKERVNYEGTQAFKIANPSFPNTENNCTALVEWCEAQLVPLTRRNLEIAWRELASEGKLEKQTEPAAEAVGNLHRLEIQPVVAAQTAKPTRKEKEALEAVKDDPNLNDHQRKVRFKKLKQAATQSRIANRKAVQVVRA